MFSEVLRRLRSKENWTQQELADRVGMAKSTISMLENGSRRPSLETLEAFADIFNVDMNTLAGGNPDLASPLREKYGILPGMDVDAIMEVFHKNPKLGVLFSRSANLSDKDIDFMLEMIDRMNPDDD